jgi:hypothetical protein
MGVLEWFARVRKYFVRNEKFRSEISRFQEGSKVLEEVLKVLRVLKLEGFNLKVKLKLKCLKGIPEGGIPEGGVPEGGVVFKRVGGIRQVPKGKGLSIPDRGLLWWFAEGVRPCERAIE